MTGRLDWKRCRRWFGAAVLLLGLLFLIVALGPVAPATAAFPGNNGVLAFVSERDGQQKAIYYQRDRGEPEHKLIDKASHPSWSADGKYIVYTSNTTGNWLIYVHSWENDYERRCSVQNGPIHWEPALSPDHLRYVVIAWSSNVDGDFDIYVDECTEMWASEPLTDNKADDGNPSWSPDGKRIAFDSNRSGHWEIYVMNADGSDQRQLTNLKKESRDPDWSPDGTQIAFHTTSNDPEGRFEVWVMNADGTQARSVTDDRWENYQPSWSPDGKKIAYTHKATGRAPQIRVLDLNSGKWDTWVVQGHNWFAAWQPKDPNNGTVTITKEVIGESDVSRWYFRTSFGEFSLTAGESMTFSQLSIGEYFLYEDELPPGWQVEVMCDSGERGGSSVTLNLSAGEKVNCVFRNTRLPRGSINVVKEVAGSPPGEDWVFSGIQGGFSLPAAGGSRLFEDLPGGKYTITETARSGWRPEVRCDTGEIGAGSVTVDLSPEGSVTCTFTNREFEVINDSYDVAKDQILSVSAPGVLANDFVPEGEPRVYYLAAGQQIREIAWVEELWHNSQLTSDPGWPLPAGGTLAATSANGAPLIYYMSNGGYINEASWHWDDNSWHLEWDIGKDSGAPAPVEGTLRATTVNGSPRVYYLTANGRIHELTRVVDQWYHRNVTSDAGGPVAVEGSPLGVITIANDDPRLYYLAEGDGGLHIHELAWISLTQVWNHTDVTAATANKVTYPINLGDGFAQINPLTVTTFNHLYPRVYYLASVRGETHVCELFWDRSDNVWYHMDITAAGDKTEASLGNGPIPRPDVGSPLAATTVDSQGDQRVYYRAKMIDEEDSKIYELGWYNGRWNFRDVTSDGDGASPNLDSSLAITSAELRPQVYYLTGQSIHQLAWNFPDTWQDSNLLSEPAWPVVTANSPLVAVTGGEIKLTARLVRNVNHGELTLNEDGSFVYEPAEGFTGRDSFVYVAYDGKIESQPVMVNLDVTDRCAPVEGNLIANFCFIEGRGPWKLFHTNWQATYTLSTDNPYAGTYSAQLGINAPARNIQFYQHGFALQPNTTYELSFAAKSNNGRDMRVYVQKHGEAYFSYGLTGQRAYLEPYWKTFTMSFTTPNLTDMNDARLRFWFAPFARAGTEYFIDHVVLRPVIIP